MIRPRSACGQKLLSLCAVLVLLLVGMQSCKKDFEDLEIEDWTPVLAVPIINTSFTVQDLLDADDSLSALVEVNSDGLLALRYTGDLATLNLETILDIDDQSASGSAEIDEAQAVVVESGVNVTIPLEYSFPVNFEPYEIEVDEVLLLGGFLNISSVFNTGEDINAALSIPQLQDAEGTPVSLTIDSTNENINLDLTGYTLNPSHPEPYTNEVGLVATITVANNSAYVSQPGDGVSLEMELVDLAFDHVIGDFGTLELELDQDSIFLDVLGDVITADNFQLQEAEIEILVTNTFGLPVELSFPTAFSENLQTGEITPLVFTEAFSLQGQQTLNGDPEETTFFIDEENSNLLDILQPAPQMLVFNAQGTANPDGSPPPTNPNFIRHDSQLDMSVDVFLPLAARIENMLLADTLEATLDFGTEEFVDSLELRIETINGFPIEAQLQLIFLDSNMVALDSLYAGPLPLLNAAPVDSDGVAFGSNTSINFISLDRDRYASLSSMKFMALRASLGTSNASEGQFSVFDNQSSLGVKVGAKIYGHEEF